MFNPEAPPEVTVSRWFNAKEPVTLEGLKGKVVVLTAFQMLCPACIEQDKGAPREQAAGIEKKLARILTNPEQTHHHDHEHGEDRG